MAFPTLVEAIKSVATRLSKHNDFQTLGLEQKSFEVGPTFDSVSVAWLTRNGYYRAASNLAGGLPTSSGEFVSISKALNHSAVWA